MKIGYARVSTSNQNLDRQIGALNAAKVDKIYREKASAKTVKGRPELERAIDALGTNDVLVIAEWDRATRSMIDGITIIQRVADRGASVKVLDKPWLDLTTPMGKGILAFLSALAEDERERIIKRANDGKAISRSKEKQLGQEADLQELEQRLADSLEERKSLEKELGDMTLQFNKVAKAAGSEKPDKAIGALMAAQSKLELELKASLEERDRLLQEIEKQASMTKTDAALDGDAALREELAKLAAEVVQMTAIVEGSGSRINSLIDNAGDDDGATISLAARVKALKKMANKSAN